MSQSEGGGAAAFARFKLLLDATSHRNYLSLRPGSQEASCMNPDGGLSDQAATGPRLSVHILTDNAVLEQLPILPELSPFALGAGAVLVRCHITSSH